MILLVSLLAAVLALPAPSGAVVTVSSQEALDSLDLAAVLPEAGDVTLSFSPGTYTFRDGMLSLAGISRPDLSVHIEGMVPVSSRTDPFTGWNRTARPFPHPARSRSISETVSSAGTGWRTWTFGRR